MSWNNTFKEVDLGSQDTITGSRPGHAIARAISEIQRRVVTDVEIKEGETLEAIITDNNVLSITVGGVSAGLPEGGTQYQVLQRDAEGNAIWDYVRAH